MAGHRSHVVVVKKHSVTSGGSKYPPRPLSSVPQVVPLPEKKVVEKKSSPSFMAWPSFLFERMMTPWRNVTAQNMTSAVSWVDGWQVGHRVIVPKSQTHETDTVYHYMVDLPNVTRDMVGLTFRNGTIILRVQEAGTSDNYAHTIRRTFTLPVYTDGAGITAELKNGLLTINIPKTDKPVSSQPCTIDIV